MPNSLHHTTVMSAMVSLRFWPVYTRANTVYKDLGHKKARGSGGSIFYDINTELHLQTEVLSIHSNKAIFKKKQQQLTAW